MNNPFPGSALVALSLGFAVPALAQRNTTGTLSTIRQVVATHASVGDPGSDNLDFERAVHGEPLVSGEAIKTLKRSYAELSLPGGSTVRLNSQTIVRVGAPLRLAKGSIWVRSGRQTVDVETKQVKISGPNATFVVTLDGEDATRVFALEGTIEVTQGPRKTRVPAGSQFRVEVKGNRVELGGVDELAVDEKPVEYGGSAIGWWRRVDEDRGLGIFPGSAEAYRLRTSPLTELVTQIGAIPPSPTDIARSPSARARLLAIARQNIIPKLEQDLSADSSLTIAGYAQQFGALAINDRFPVGGANLAFLLDHGIGNVGQLFEALGATGSGFGLDIRSVPTRAVWRPSSLEGPSNERFKLFDGAQRNLNISVAGLALGLLTERSGLRRGVLEGELSLFGMSADPQAFGGRGTLKVRYGHTQVEMEANLVRILSGSQSRTYDQPDSVFSVERDLGNGTRVFAGRRRFLAGPVFQNAVRSQLVADRYTGLGAAFRRSGTEFEVAYLTDANADVRGDQGGALATASRQIGRGKVGIQAMRVPKLRDGNGITVSAAHPIATLDVYAEYGRGPDSSTLATAGVYLPGLFQSSDIDVFVEYGSHRNVGRTLSFIAAKEIAGGPSVRAFLNLGKQPDDRTGVTGGIGLIYPIGSRQ